MNRYTVPLEGIDEAIVLKLVGRKVFGFTIRATIRTIIQDWVRANELKLKEWGIDVTQLGKDLMGRSTAK
jgi:hypothetical protein